jgi:hypothetical protein
VFGAPDADGGYRGILNRLRSELAGAKLAGVKLADTKLAKAKLAGAKPNA